MNTGTLRLLPHCIRRDVHSRTWDTLPADDPISSTATVWIESTISREGSSSVAVARIASRSVAERMWTWASWTPSRSARSRIWCALSSAETYSTGAAAVPNPAAACRTSVDFPIPGSPPMSASVPGTRPPPSTRSSSEMGTGIRVTPLAPSNASGCGFSALRLARSAGAARRSSIVSTIEFHAPQPGHLPR